MPGAPLPLQANVVVTGLFNERLLTGFLFHVLVAFAFISAALVLWMSYGRLRYLTLPKMREDVRSANLVLAILLFVICAVGFIGIAVVASRRPLAPHTAAMLVSGSFMVALLLAVAICALLVNVYARRDKSRARMAALVGAWFASAAVIIVFLAMISVYGKRAMRAARAGSSAGVFGGAAGATGGDGDKDLWDAMLQGIVPVAGAAR